MVEREKRFEKITRPPLERKKRITIVPPRSSIIKQIPVRTHARSGYERQGIPVSPSVVSQHTRSVIVPPEQSVQLARQRARAQYSAFTLPTPPPPPPPSSAPSDEYEKDLKKYYYDKSKIPLIIDCPATSIIDGLNELGMGYLNERKYEFMGVKPDLQGIYDLYVFKNKTTNQIEPVSEEEVYNKKDLTKRNHDSQEVLDYALKSMEIDPSKIYFDSRERVFRDKYTHKKLALTASKVYDQIEFLRKEKNEEQKAALLY